MDKYQNNALVEEMDAIILLNDNYSDKGLLKGYIGDVMSNFIEKYGEPILYFKKHSINNLLPISRKDWLKMFKRMSSMIYNRY